MKVEIIKEKIQPIVLKTERIAGKHPSLPILSHFLLTAKKGFVSLRATNLEIGVECTVPAKVEKEGVVAVPAATFSSFVVNSGATRSIMLEERDKVLSVSASAVQAKIKTAPPDDFPNIPKAKGVEFNISPSQFIAGLRSVVYAGAIGSLKPELGSVFITSFENDIVFAATDSFRLAEKRVSLKNIPPISPLLIPIRNAGEFIRLLEDEGGDDTTVIVEKGQVSIKTARMDITSRLLEGVFPDYQQIIPKETVAEAVALKGDMIAALKSTVLFSDRFNQVRLLADPKKKLFELSARNSELGESQATIPAALSGAVMESNFNHRYLSDCLSSIESDSVSFGWSGEGRPLLIRGVGNGSFRYIVMPMNR